MSVGSIYCIKMGYIALIWSCQATLVFILWIEMDWKQGSKPREQGSKPIDGRIIVSCIGPINLWRSTSWIFNFILKGSDLSVMWYVSQTSNMLMLFFFFLVWWFFFKGIIFLKYIPYFLKAKNIYFSLKKTTTSPTQTHYICHVLFSKDGIWIVLTGGAWFSKKSM